MLSPVLRVVLGADCVTYNVSPGVPAGENWIATVYRVQISSPQPTTFFIKCLPVCQARRTALQSDIFFENEVQFYGEVLPEFLKFQEEKEVKNSFQSLVKIHYISSDTIIMEDMKQQGYVMLDKTLSLDACHLHLVLKELGRFHGFSFGLKNQNPEKFDHLKTAVHETIFSKSCGQLQFTNILIRAWNACLKLARRQFDKDDLEKIEAFFGDILQNMSELAKPKEPYSVILHGDMYTNNILFHYPPEKANKEPDKLCFVDFQMSRYGSPALDLSYILFFLADKNTRQNCRHDLLKIYHDSLKDFVSELGSDVDQLFPFPALQEEMKVHSSFGMALTLFGIPGTMTREENSVDVNINYENASDVVEAICSSFENMNPKCEKKIMEVIKEALDYGYLK